jgi:hypothetical protein
VQALVQKAKEIERTLSDKKGSFSLFALFLREDAAGVWDLLVSAQWIEKNKRAALTEISNALREKLSEEELLSISRIVMPRRDDPGLKAIQKVISIEHGDAEVKNCVFFGLEIRQAFIITSKRTSAAA